MGSVKSSSLETCLHYISSFTDSLESNTLNVDTQVLKERIKKAITHSHLCLNMADEANLPSSSGLLLSDLQVWQQNRVRSTHKELFSDRYTAPLVRYLLEQAYAGHTHKKLIIDIERMLPQIINRFPAELLGSLCLILELNVTVQAVDLILHDALVDSVSLTAGDYRKAYQVANVAPVREKQFQTIEALSVKMDEYFINKLIYTAFKLARFPAKIAGLGLWVKFIDDGFEAVQLLAKHHGKNGVQTVVSQVVEKERLINQEFSQEEA